MENYIFYILIISLLSVIGILKFIATKKSDDGTISKSEWTEILKNINITVIDFTTKALKNKDKFNDEKEVLEYVTDEVYKTIDTMVQDELYRQKLLDKEFLSELVQVTYNTYKDIIKKNNTDS